MSDFQMFSSFIREPKRDFLNGYVCITVCIYQPYFYSCSLQKPTGAAGGAIPRRRNGKVFLGKPHKGLITISLVDTE